MDGLLLVTEQQLQAYETLTRHSKGLVGHEQKSNTWSHRNIAITNFESSADSSIDIDDLANINVSCYAKTSCGFYIGKFLNQGHVVLGGGGLIIGCGSGIEVTTDKDARLSRETRRMVAKASTLEPILIFL
nr:hypothetical protein Iba_chr11aCG9070 [Ipomoea batatas]